MSKKSANSQNHSPPAGGRSTLFLPHLDVLAHTGRSILVAQALAARGWRVSFAGAGKYAQIAEDAGFQVHALPEMPAAELVAQSRRGKRWPFHSADQVRPFVAAELRLYEQVGPDVVVFDHRYSAGLSAEVAGIPRAAITNIWWTPYDARGMGLAETHPIFAVAPPLRFVRRFGWADPLGNALARSMFRRWIRPYNIVRVEHGLHSVGSILDLFAGDAVILPDTPELAPSRTMPPNYHCVGPLVWEPAGQLPAQVASMEPFVYVTMGSSADPRIFDIAVAAIDLLEGVPAVVTTGGVRRPEEFQPRESSAFYDFLPGSAAAEKAAVVVCQGGIGTVYQALAAGKPLVGVPFMPEQEVYGIGAVERLGAGLSVSPRQLDAGRLAAAIRCVLEDPAYRLCTERLSETIDLASGPGKAAEIISRLIQ